MLAALQDLLVDLGGLLGYIGAGLNVDNSAPTGAAGADGSSDVIELVLLPLANVSAGAGGLGELLVDIGALLGALGTA